MTSNRPSAATFVAPAREILLFLVLTAIISIPGWYATRNFGGPNYVGLLMWSPALAAWLIQRFIRPTVALGLRAPDAKITFGACVAVLLIVAVPQILLYAFGSVTLDPGQTLEQAKKLGLEGHTQAALVLGFLLAATMGTIRMTANTLGEEIGWRGYLAPALTNLLGFRWGVIATGLCWASWHLPLLWGQVSLLNGLYFFVSLTGFSALLNWTSLRTSSAWPAALMHGVHNAVSGGFLVALATPGPATDRLLGETGLPVTVAYLLAGAYVMWKLAPVSARMFDRSSKKQGRKAS
jgi:uncharacterized protein